MDHAQYEGQLFLTEITGTDQQMKLFILSKYHMLLLSYESFSILSDVFFSKKFHFQLKQLCVPVYKLLTV